MSTEADARVEADPFRYGYRFVEHEQSDGRVEVEMVPLTPDDLLFPREYDHEMRSPEHVMTCLRLYEIFEERMADVPGAFVLTDHRVDYDVPGVQPVGPDISIFLEAPKPYNSATLDVAETGARPLLVVEVTSPDTRKNDFGIKKDIYHRAGVPFYVILDFQPPQKQRPIALHGFRHTPGGYEPIPLDDRGRLWLEPLNLWLAIVDDRITCIDGDTGEEIGNYRDQVRGRRSAEARAEVERERADAERARAEAEAEARRDLEARLRAMEEENRRLRGD